MKPYKIIFLGTPEFAVPTLEDLIKDERFEIIAVISEPDRYSGRGKKNVFLPVKKFVENCNMELLRLSPRNDDRNQIQILQPTKIENCKLIIENLQPDLAVVAAYGQIIPQDILEIPKYGFVNVHPSLLPKYRGPSPIQTAILNGDRETGVTIVKVDEKMDHGQILATIKIQMTNVKQNPNDKCQISKLNYQKLSQILSKFGAELLIKVLPDYLKGKIKPQPQDHKKATFTKLVKKEDGLIDWNEPVEIIERKIRAYFPWPGTHTFLNRKRLKILKAHLIKSTYEVDVGQDRKNKKLVLDLVQLEGKKAIGWEEFKRGYRQPIDISDKIVI